MWEFKYKFSKNLHVEWNVLILSMHNMKLNARKLRKTSSKIRLSTKIPPLNEEGECHGKNLKLPPTNFFNFY